MRIHAMAARSRGGELAPWTYEPGALGPFDCLLRVLACGLCGSDLHMIDNAWGMSRYPLVPGHEVIVEVVAFRPSEAYHRDLPLGRGQQRHAAVTGRPGPLSRGPDDRIGAIMLVVSQRRGTRPQPR